MKRTPDRNQWIREFIAVADKPLVADPQTYTVTLSWDRPDQAGGIDWPVSNGIPVDIALKEIIEDLPELVAGIIARRRRDAEAAE